MNSTDVRSRLIAIVGYLSALVIVYLTLVIADAMTRYYLQTIDGTRAARLEEERACEEDYRLIDEARSAGLKSLIYPDLYDAEPYRALAEKYDIAPLASLPRMDIYYCNEGYGQVRYRSDRYGFRNDDSLWDAPTVDVALIGDSFVQGACVADEQSISGVLNAKGLTTLNLGMAGNSPIHYAAIARTFTAVRKPATVVVVFYPNDNLDSEDQSIFNRVFFQSGTRYFRDTAHQGMPPVSEPLRRLHDESLALLSSGEVELDASRKEAQRQCRESATFSSRLADLRTSLREHVKLTHIKQLVKGYMEPAPEVQNTMPFGTRLAIDVVIEECSQHGCDPLFVYIPNSRFWRPDYRAEQYLHILKSHIDSRGARLVDMTEPIDRLGRSAYAIRGPHLSPDGYQAVAQEIAKALQAPGGK